MKDRKALFITKKAKDNTFIDCDIEGAQIEGQGTKMIRTRIFNFQKKHPKIWVGLITSLIVTIIGGGVLLIIEYGLFH